MGITVFLLFLMATSGIALVIKRTNGLKHIFAKIKKQSSVRYYHTLLGRLTFVPIVIMSLSGTVLFLNTQFDSALPIEKEHVLNQAEQISLAEFRSEERRVGKECRIRWGR